MKQNKLIIGGLLVIAILIWGTVLLRFREMKNGDGDKGSVPVFKKSIGQSVPIDKTYKLLLDYEDPFMKDWTKQVVHPRPTIEKVAKEVQKTMSIAEELEGSKADRLKRVKYYGFVGHSDRNHAYGFVEEEGKLFMVSEGDSLFDWRIRMISNDSIVVMNGKASAVIHVFK